VDRESLGKWDKYTRAKEATFLQTDTADAPWPSVQEGRPRVIVCPDGEALDGLLLTTCSSPVRGKRSNVAIVPGA
jgi:hypothetical protein